MLFIRPIGIPYAKLLTNWGLLFEHPLGCPSTKLYTKLKSLAQVVLKICSIVCQKFYGSHDLGQAPFAANYLSARSAFPRRSCTPNLKSLAQVVLKICSIVFRKF